MGGGIIGDRQSRRFPVISTHLYSMNIEQQSQPVPIIEQRSSIIPLLELEGAVAGDETAVELDDSPPPTTETQYHQSNTGMDLPRPKIVIFGASGRTGRRILCKLLNSGANVDIVAYTRDPIKLGQVLYNNEDLVLGNLINNDRISNDRGGDQNNSRNGSGPTLRVVVGNVVSSRQNNIYQGHKKMKIKDTGLRGLQFVMPLFWGRSTYNNATTTSVGTIGNGNNASLLVNDDCSTKDDDDDDDDDAILQDAISGATVLISCLGTRRQTNVWTDFLRVPILRIVRCNNIGKWCTDMTHPYYVNYITTKRILEVAEREQRKREVSIELLERERLMLDERLNQLKEEEEVDEEEGFESEIAAGLRKKRQHELYEQQQREKRPLYSHDIRNVVTMPLGGKLLSTTDRIKFIRISHARVGRNPFRLRNILNNILWSQVSRYERMGEMVLEESALVDTIVLRPGDMTNEERNMNTTSLQLCVDGVVPSPSIVGREDVADIAAILALTKTSSSSATVPEYNYDNNMKFPPPMRLAQHWTWAMRWTGQYISPPQGLRPDGQPNAATCFVLSIKEQIERDRKRKLRMEIMKTYHGGREVLRLKRWSRRSLSPHLQSLAILLPVYLTLGIISTYLFRPTFIELYSQLSRGTIHRTLMKLVS
jgi:hypothetical protein